MLEIGKVFFGFESPLYGVVVIVALWIATLFAILNFFKISSSSAVLLLPYILWISFAAVLNISVWILNPQAQYLFVYRKPDFN